FFFRVDVNSPCAVDGNPASVDVNPPSGVDVNWLYFFFLGPAARLSSTYFRAISTTSSHCRSGHFAVAHSSTAPGTSCHDSHLTRNALWLYLPVLLYCITVGALPSLRATAAQPSPGGSVVMWYPGPLASNPAPPPSPR